MDWLKLVCVFNPTCWPFAVASMVTGCSTPEVGRRGEDNKVYRSTTPTEFEGTGRCGRDPRCNPCDKAKESLVKNALDYYCGPGGGTARVRWEKATASGYADFKERFCSVRVLVSRNQVKCR